MEIITGLSPRTVRFGTVADNQASRHMGEQDGFRLIFECRRVVAGMPDQKPDTEFVPETAADPLAGPEDLDAVMRYLKGSENSRRTRGLYAWGWTFQEMSREFVAGILARRGGLVIRKKARIKALALFLPQRHGPRSCLGFIDGGQEEMTELARRFRSAAARRGAQGLFAMVPEQAVPALCGAGFRQEYPIEVVVYELSGELLEVAMKKSVGGDRIG
jgi:hypothetical protein